MVPFLPTGRADVRLLGRLPETPLERLLMAHREKILRKVLTHIMRPNNNDGGKSRPLPISRSCAKDRSTLSSLFGHLHLFCLVFRGQSL
jgi:hypothetical protein